MNKCLWSPSLQLGLQTPRTTKPGDTLPSFPLGAMFWWKLIPVMKSSSATWIWTKLLISAVVSRPSSRSGMIYTSSTGNLKSKPALVGNCCILNSVTG
eukprot:m.442427 g.442427  ORF g.442427 m.442427 type:complete len:98 (-) comp18805_c0_seq1:143-436(-)